MSCKMVRQKNALMAQNVANDRNRSPVAAGRRDFSRPCRPFRARPAGRGRGACARRLCADAGVGAGRARRRPDRDRQCLRDDDARLHGGAVQDRRHAARPRVRGRAQRAIPASSSRPSRSPTPMPGTAGSARPASARGRLRRSSGRSTPRPAPTPPPSRWRGSSPARWRKAASRCSPTTPRTRCGSRAGSRIRTARAGSRASRSSSPMSTKRRRAMRASPHRPALRTRAGQAVQLDRGRIDLVTREAFAAALPEIAIPSLPFIGGLWRDGDVARCGGSGVARRRPVVAPRGRCPGRAVSGGVGEGRVAVQRRQRFRSRLAADLTALRPRFAAG